MLAEVGEQVVAVHGQSDQLRLLRPAEQRAALDRFAGAGAREAAGDVPRAFARWRAVADDLADRRRNARERSQEADLLRLGLDEITRVDPQPGEDEELRAEAQRLEHAEGLRTAAQLAHQAIAGGGDGPTTRRRHAACSAPPGARWRRSPASTRRWASWPPGSTRRPPWSATSSAELSAYLASLDADPARLQTIYERRADAARADPQVRRRRRRRDRLGRPGPGPAGASWTPPTSCSTSWTASGSAWPARWPTLAGRLRAARRRGRRPLRRARSRVELAGLAMPHARVEVVVAPHGRRGEPSLTVDGVECGVGRRRRRRGRAAAAGPPGRAVAAAAAGRLRRRAVPGDAGHRGGLRRCRRPADAGLRRGRRRVSAAQAAVEIGRRLARLARNHQVLVVTHLPQVAAFADRHLVVAKDTGGRDHHQRGAGGRGDRAGPGAGPDAGRACRTPIWASRTPRSCSRWPPASSAADTRAVTADHDPWAAMCSMAAACSGMSQTQSSSHARMADDASSHFAPDPDRRTGHRHRHRPARPPDQASGRPAAPRRHRGDRPRRPRPGRRRLAGRRRGRRGAQRQAVDLRPLPEPRSARC